MVLTHVPQGRRLVRRCPTYQTVRRAMPLLKEVVYRLLKAGRSEDSKGSPCDGGNPS